MEARAALVEEKRAKARQDAYERQAAKNTLAEQQRVKEQLAASEQAAKEAQEAALRKENAKKAEELVKDLAAQEFDDVAPFIDSDCEFVFFSATRC